MVTSSASTKYLLNVTGSRDASIALDLFFIETKHFNGLFRHEFGKLRRIGWKLGYKSCTWL